MKNKYKNKEYNEQKIIFYDKEFYIDSRAYIPTPETEALLNEAIKEIPLNASIIDVGTGSGVIGISLNLERPDLKIIATDKDKQALEIAKINKEKHGAKILFRQNNYVNGILKEPDVIIANLPWGDNDFLLETNKYRFLNEMPLYSYFHPGGRINSYVELIQSIVNKRWTPIIYLETGVLTKEEIKKIIPKNFDWIYHQVNLNYSITKIFPKVKA